jgi:DNA-directed RNA polymerase II subunit RPB1
MSKSMSKKIFSMNHQEPAKIIGLQFSILSPEEIRKGSVAEITSRSTYDNKNKPYIGGLFDPRMGVLEDGMFCPTDGLDHIQTPGYFGHIELARPVFYIQYLTTIMKVLDCVCFKCSKLLISKEKYNQALKMVGHARWDYVHKIASKMKRCGEDSEDGCGCLKPDTIRKESLADLFAEWKGKDDDNIVIKLLPEMVLKIFKRISDEDVSFMGFSPIWSRPDWMICQVMSVAPPAVRPSVRNDSQQHSEDDLTHILVNIVKTNKTLQEKIDNNSPSNIIDDWTSVLQYYVATLIDNNIPGVASVAQRNGRPLKSLKARINGKSGRLRTNLMAKRVDFSARSVITADPNISIRELGIPMKVAMNITKPVVVNKLNKAFAYMLVRNGADVYPGAKILERKNGESFTLRCMLDRNSIVLEEGDIVHRHMMDGDAILFNRQPTLHRMSMMCHIAKIMEKGDTFRMNVADTKPYNADFDGDEMNLHMPQDPESESELKHLAAVPYQIISPGNNTSIIGIFQDSMLGSYQITRENVRFSKRDAMNILMMYDNVNEMELFQKEKETITSFDILSQILPPLTIKYKTKSFKEGEDEPATSNKVLDIKNGKFLRGQIDKGVLGSGTKGLIQRICNDFGNRASSDFIDNLQNIVTNYLKTAGFSVGISDLISNEKTNSDIVKVITNKKTEVKNLIDQIQLGLFDNTSGKTNQEEFETKVNNILNQASSESGKIGLKNLSKNNRFVTMVNAGSKGSELNISFMISCVGQQNVDGKRIPYGFEHRTLPHFTKFDDSPSARGFVESSYINGLSPQELFFHAMGGRVGLIDTAVKTSTTGYIQRRLIKSLEDLMVNYDMSVRTSKNKIVQFRYGEDGIDNVKVETQMASFLAMSTQDIYGHFNLLEDMSEKVLKTIFENDKILSHKKEQNQRELHEKSEKYMNFILEMRKEIIENVQNKKDDLAVNCPVAFQYIMNNVQGQLNITKTSMVDITILEAYELIEETYANLEKNHYSVPTLLFKSLYFFNLSPKDLLIVKRFNKRALTLLLEKITLDYKRAIVAPGEMVGMIAGQSIGEISTQMTLNTFHFAGVASKSNVTRGVPRIEEILTLTPKPKNPSLSVYLKPEHETSKEKAITIMYMLEHTRLEDIVKSVEVCFDPDDRNTYIQEDKEWMEQFNYFEDMMEDCVDGTGTGTGGGAGEKSKWIIRMVMDPEVMLEKNITMDDVNFTLKSVYDKQVNCIYSDYNSEKLVFRIRMNDVLKEKKAKKGENNPNQKPLDQSDKIYLLKNFQDQMLQNIVLRGVKGIDKVILRKVNGKDNMIEKNGVYIKQDIWLLDTIGTNMLEVLALDYVDTERTYSNSIIENYNVLGIEAARQSIYNELVDVISFDGTYLNYHNFSILVDRMTFTHKLISIFRHGLNNDDTGPITKASFEETPTIFLKAARHAELDIMRGVSANIMCGQEGYYGTSAFQVLLDLEEMRKYDAQSEYVFRDEQEEIEKAFQGMGIEDPADRCSMANLTMNNNVNHIMAKDMGYSSVDYELDI